MAALGLHDLVDTADAHFTELRKHGVRMPWFDYYLEAENLVIVADQVDGWPLEEKRRPLPFPVPQDQVDTYSSQARHGLTAYGDHVRKTIHLPTALGGYILGDITSDKQWMIGTSVAEPEQGEGMFMVDPDPIIHFANPHIIRTFFERANNLRP